MSPIAPSGELRELDEAARAHLDRDPPSYEIGGRQNIMFSASAVSSFREDQLVDQWGLEWGQAGYACSRGPPALSCYHASVQILLSHGVAPEDGPIASRLKAVTAAYGVKLLLPSRTASSALDPSTRDSIQAADAIVALVTKDGADKVHVARELQEAISRGKPIVALVEGDLELPTGTGGVHVVRFERDDPTKHEQGLVEALDAIRARTAAAAQQAKLDAVAIGALITIAIGLLALGAVALASKDDDKPVVLR